MRSPILSISLRVIGSAIAGFVTSVVITLVLAVCFHESWLAFQLRRVFGLGPVLASAADPTWFEGEGQVDVVPWRGIHVYDTVFLVSWPLIFAAVYFWVWSRRANGPNQTLQPT